MIENERRVAAEDLLALVRTVFERCGMSHRDADLRRAAAALGVDATPLGRD